MATRDSISRLYGGQYEVTYKNGNHRYYIGNDVIPSVTTIMGKVLAKPDLMLWPMNLALKYLEERLPTITPEDLKMARTAHVRSRDSGANTGTAVHHLVEQRLTTPWGEKLPVDFSVLPTEVGVAYTAFETWYKQYRPRVIACEQVVFSPSLYYVGTYDAILEIDGKVCLCDIKTTNASASAIRGIYPEHFVQMGAYYYAYEEQRKADAARGHKTKLGVPIDDLMVISVKKNGRIDTLSASELGVSLDDLAEVWRSIMTIHDQMRKLKEKIGGAL